jgi:hypothetical protein
VDVLREALNAEHGTFERDSGGCRSSPTMSSTSADADSVDSVAGVVAPDSGWARVARLEAAMSARTCSAARDAQTCAISPPI